MAITQVQKPAGFVGVNGRLIISLTSDNVAEPKFRFKVSLYKDGTTLISTSYIDPDPNNFGIYDCSPRLQNIVTPQLHDGNTPATRVSIFDIAVGEAFVEVLGSHEEITVTLDESYAATVDDEPTDQGINDQFTFTIYPGATQTSEGINVNTGKGILAIGETSKALINVSKAGPGKVFQSRVTFDDRFCLAWFNDNEDSVEAITWRYIVKRENGTLVTEDITVASHLVGAGDGTILYFMCGPQDLADFTGLTAANRPTSTADWVSYTVRPFNATVAIGAGYEFIKHDCSKFDNYQLAFPNKEGAWNFQTFHLLSSKRIESKAGKTFMRQVGDTNFGNSEYGYDIYARETGQYGIESKVKLDLNTPWLSREEAADLEAVIYSRDVRMLVNGSPIPVPVIVSTRSHRFDKYKKMRQYKISIEVAQKYYNL